MHIEEELFFKYLHEHNLRCTPERKDILKYFLESEEHLTLDNIYKTVKKGHQKLNLSTVFRTMKVLIDIGLTAEWKGPDKKTYFEHKYKHGHHDHMICESCGKIVEFSAPLIEKLQRKAAKKHRFKINSHKLVLYGLCRKCS